MRENLTKVINKNIIFFFMFKIIILKFFRMVHWLGLVAKSLIGLLAVHEKILKKYFFFKKYLNNLVLYSDNKKLKKKNKLVFGQFFKVKEFLKGVSIKDSMNNENELNWKDSKGLSGSLVFFFVLKIFIFLVIFYIFVTFMESIFIEFFFPDLVCHNLKKTSLDKTYILLLSPAPFYGHLKSWFTGHWLFSTRVYYNSRKLRRLFGKRYYSHISVNVNNRTFTNPLSANWYTTIQLVSRSAKRYWFNIPKGIPVRNKYYRVRTFFFNYGILKRRLFNNDEQNYKIGKVGSSFYRAYYDNRFRKILGFKHVHYSSLTKFLFVHYTRFVLWWKERRIYWLDEIYIYKKIRRTPSGVPHRAAYSKFLKFFLPFFKYFWIPWVDFWNFIFIKTFTWFGKLIMYPKWGKILLFRFITMMTGTFLHTVPIQFFFCWFLLIIQLYILFMFYSYYVNLVDHDHDKDFWDFIGFFFFFFFIYNLSFIFYYFGFFSEDILQL